MSRIHRNLKRAALLFATTSLILACLIFTAGAVQPGSVTGDDVRLRTQPSKESGIVTTLNEGDALEILDSSNSDWLQVSHTDANGTVCTGYISRELAHIGPSGSAQVNHAGVTQTATVNDGGVLLYSEPDAGSDVCAAIDAGGVVTLLNGKADGWQLVSYTTDTGSCSGYASTASITLNPMALGIAKSTDTQVRTHPFASADLSAELEAGTLVYILDMMGDWYQVRVNDVTGYIEAAQVTTGHEDNSLLHGTATGDSLRLRSSADTSAKVLTTLSSGVTFQITSDSVDGWYATRYNGKTGYVSADYVELTDAKGGYVQVTAPSLPLMSGAGSSFAALAEIEQGTVLTISGVLGSWYLVSYEGYCGFINSAYVSFTTEKGYYDGVNGSGLGAQVAAFACQFAGNPYQWGGTSLTNGADCSGFVLKVYQNFGVSLPHSSSAMRSCGRGVSYSEMQPGDIVCYSGHVGIYAGNGKIINALGEAYGITYTDVNYKGILAIRRIFD